MTTTRLFPCDVAVPRGFYNLEVKLSAGELKYNSFPKDWHNYPRAWV